MNILVLSDADGKDGGDDGNVPTTLPAWQVPRGYHAQGSNIPFGESLTLITRASIFTQHRSFVRVFITVSIFHVFANTFH